MSEKTWESFKTYEYLGNASDVSTDRIQRHRHSELDNRAQVSLPPTPRCHHLIHYEMIRGSDTVGPPRTLNPDPHHHQLREVNPRTTHLSCLNKVFTDWFSSLFNNQPITHPLTSKQVSSAPIRSLTLIDSWFVVIRIIRSRDSLWFDIYVVTRRPFWVLMVSCIKNCY